ncbi:hypothetical protein BpHYR1_053213 [Brachionus plicatilis]|uniref:Uncharacterized protein n=1 Tax=Brachionus plicatilis TaxID=10195 RepID=A0A3M7SIX3_BRAPC|nr:hypothetical protein BpHYR1_053213 [Brachionus plicatilis]
MAPVWWLEHLCVFLARQTTAAYSRWFRENVTPRSFSVSTKASALLDSSFPISSSDLAYMFLPDLLNSIALHLLTLKSIRHLILNAKIIYSKLINDNEKLIKQLNEQLKKLKSDLNDEIHILKTGNNFGYKSSWKAGHQCDKKKGITSCYSLSSQSVRSTPSGNSALFCLHLPGVLSTPLSDTFGPFDYSFSYTNTEFLYQCRVIPNQGLISKLL